MLNVRRILVSAIALAGFAVATSGCGQKGPLYLPTDPAAAQRATLPEIINSTLPLRSSEPAAPQQVPAAPAAPASSAR